jgi:hypothetical protein
LADHPGPSAAPPPARTAEAAALDAALAAPGPFWISAPASIRDELLVRLIDALLQRGERLLIMAALATAANRLVECFRDRGAIRALAPSESSADLPPSVAPAASTAAGRGRVEEQRGRLAEKIRELREQLAHRQALAGIWDQLRTVRCVCAGHQRPACPDRARVEADLTGLRAERAALAPLVAAKQSGNIFSRAFWSATFHAERLNRAAELDARIRECERSLAGPDDTPLPVRCPAAESGTFERLVAELRSAGIAPPAAPTAEAIAAAHQAAEGDRQEAEANLNFAVQSLADLESDPEGLAVIYLNRAALVVGTPGARFDLAIERGTFDRRILEGAESVTESALNEWDLLASQSDRTLVLGDFVGHGPMTDRWAVEHRPGWCREAGRLVARLRPDANSVHAEPLADRPDVELRFGRAPDGAFVLAAVAFPPETSVADAKAFLAADLDEIDLVPLGPDRWNADELLVVWPLLESDDGVWIDVAPGVQERVVSVDSLPATAGVRFDTALWSREAAAAWVDARARSARERRTAAVPLTA